MYWLIVNLIDNSSNLTENFLAHEEGDNSSSSKKSGNIPNNNEVSFSVLFILI